MSIIGTAGIIALSLLPAVSQVQARSADRRRVETYQSAAIDSAGRLVIITSDQRTVVVPTEGDQKSFDTPIVSPGRTAVGAQAEFGNCCTSYDIPLQLVVYANGKVHRFVGNGLPIFQWNFDDEGTRVSFGQEPVHFGCSIHYELREIRSERLLDSVDIPEPCGEAPNPPAVNTPKWVADLNAAMKQR